MEKVIAKRDVIVGCHVGPPERGFGVSFFGPFRGSLFSTISFDIKPKAAD